MSAKASDKKSIDYLFIVVILLAILGTIFWIMLLTHAYRTFEYGTYDLAYETYNLYMDIHYTSVVHGLQFFVLSNNLSPDVLLILPIFFLRQSALTLVYIQIITLGLSSVIIFWVTRKLSKSSLIATAFSIAFLINPGVWGILTFDFHMEFLMIPFYILTFYYYMTSNKKLFALSLLLLLGTLEVAPLLSITLALGLFAYERSQSKGKAIPKDKKFMISAMLIASLVALVLYYGAISYLVSSYATSYPQLPAILEISHGNIASLISSISTAVNGPIQWLKSLLFVYQNPALFIILIISIPITFLGFGIASLYKPKITILLLLSWFIEVILEGWTKTAPYIYPGLYGYSYTIGATFAAALIGIMLIPNKAKKIAKNYGYMIAFSTLIIAVVVSMFTLLISSAPIVFLLNYNNPNPIPSYNATQITQLANMIPQNASLFTLNFIAPHLAQRRYLEFPATEAVTGNYFVPDYILYTAANYSNISTNKNLSGNFGYLISNYTYILISKQGDARLYEIENKPTNK